MPNFISEGYFTQTVIPRELEGDLYGKMVQYYRDNPNVTVIVDRPDNVRRWFEIVDALTAQTGLVTSEVVPAARAARA